MFLFIIQMPGNKDIKSMTQRQICSIKLYMIIQGHIINYKKFVKIFNNNIKYLMIITYLYSNNIVHNVENNTYYTIYLFSIMFKGILKLILEICCIS